VTQNFQKSAAKVTSLSSRSHTSVCLSFSFTLFCALCFVHIPLILLSPSPPCPSLASVVLCLSTCFSLSLSRTNTQGCDPARCFSLVTAERSFALSLALSISISLLSLFFSLSFSLSVDPTAELACSFYLLIYFALFLALSPLFSIYQSLSLSLLLSHALARSLPPLSHSKTSYACLL
jgi:hypothetical protein